VEATGWAQTGAASASEDGAYVDTRTFAALSERQFNASTPSTSTSSVNGVTYNDPALVGGSAGHLDSLMVVSDAVGANTASFLTGISSATVTPCRCDYTRWGFWSLQGSRNDPINGNDYTIHNESVKAKVVIHNILGRTMSEAELPTSETKIKIQAEELATGVYFYTLYLDNNGVLTRKLIVRK